jgi:hypothetical protein|tara:strand:- start:1485 stop:2048 length:564 start_codon:yes stop_codon:yes gene_type:complete
MQINIIDVGEQATHTAKNGRSYQSVEITYKGDNGQTSSKKLMSFANPDVFKQAGSWKKGDSINVNTQKDDAGYWQWIGILADGEAQTSPSPTNTAPRVGGASTTTRVTGSNYPTSDERAKTQNYIIRQSSLSNAIATLNIKGTKDLTESPSDAVITLAQKYEAYVLTGAQAQGDENTDLDFGEDVPL